ncbi:hypothetical protein M9458_002967, partial [Cirrhinus mrigala]
TNIQDTVPKRMADTYREAAVSITITTLTDVLAFYLSYGNPFGSVQSFCLYAGTAILFCYFYNITFFGACLALNGRREGANRHWLTCMKDGLKFILSAVLEDLTTITQELRRSIQ